MRAQPLSPDFRRLWGAHLVSAAGSGVGLGALPIVAVLVLHASTFQVSLLTALSGAAAAAIALPLGTRIEYRRKRPVMMAADLIRFAVLASVPVAAAFGVLTFAQLCLAGIMTTAGAIVFSSASGAHLKALVGPGQRLHATSRMETATWVTLTAGPPLGGLLISATGATATMAIDAASYLLSAIGVRRIRQPEPAPPDRPHLRQAHADLISGWRYIFAHRGLRALFINAMVFGGPVTMISPLLAVLMLRYLGLTPAGYGLALGLPCAGGILGSQLAPALTRRHRRRRVLLTFGLLRTPWLLLLPLAPHGMAGLALIVSAETALLFTAGVFNPSFAAYQMDATDDAFMARVLSSWSISSKTIQPLFITAGGVLSAIIGLRPAMALGGLICMSSGILLLPWERAAAASEPAPVTAAN